MDQQASLETSEDRGEALKIVWKLLRPHYDPHKHGSFFRVSNPGTGEVHEFKIINFRGHYWVICDGFICERGWMKDFH